MCLSQPYGCDRRAAAPCLLGAGNFDSLEVTPNRLFASERVALALSSSVG